MVNLPQSKQSERLERAGPVHPFMDDVRSAGRGENRAFRVVNTRSTICQLLMVLRFVRPKVQRDGKVQLSPPPYNLLFS
jgi:hypothetical protein